MPNIVIYSTPTCAFCKQAKEYFKNKDIPYSDIDVASNPDKAQELIEKSGQMGVPVIDIDGEIIVGFDQSAINKKLGLK